MKPFISLFVLSTILMAGEFIVNGDFEDLLNGWNPYAQGETYTLLTDKSYDEDPDSEVYVGRLDKLVTVLYQTCNIPVLNLDFSFNARLIARSYDSLHRHAAVASIIISYLNNEEEILGETRIFNFAETLYWVPSPTLHLIEIGDTNWFSDTINIIDELQNLPGINPSSIAKLRIILYSQANGC